MPLPARSSASARLANVCCACVRVSPTPATCPSDDHATCPDTWICDPTRTAWDIPLTGSMRVISAPTAGSPVKVEPQHLDRVAAHQLVGQVVGNAFEHLGGDLLGVGPRRVGVGVVGLEGDVVGADVVEHLHPERIAE